MAPRVDLGLVADILGGDPLLTPAEAAAQLGIDTLELADRDIPAIQVGHTRRYRTSVIAALAGPPHPG